MVAGPGRDGEEECVYIHWSYVGQRAPWRHSRNWEPPDESAPAEPDRIAALEQQVVGRILDLEERAAGAINDRIAALEQRMAGRIAPLEQRVAELEAFKRAVTAIPARRFA